MRCVTLSAGSEAAFELGAFRAGDGVEVFKRLVADCRRSIKTMMESTVVSSLCFNVLVRYTTFIETGQLNIYTLIFIRITIRSDAQHHSTPNVNAI